jgi:hypothetical protein
VRWRTVWRLLMRSITMRANDLSTLRSARARLAPLLHQPAHRSPPRAASLSTLRSARARLAPLLHRSPPRVASLFLVAAVAACAVEPVDEPPVFTPYNGNCPPLECTNSSDLLYQGIHDLHLRGQPNNRNITIEGHPKTNRAQIYSAAGDAYDLHVKQGRLFGVDRNGHRLEHGDLAGAEIRLLQGGVPLYNLHIHSARDVLITVGPQDPHEVYVMTWRGPEDPVTTRRPACNYAYEQPPVVLHKGDPDDYLNMLPGELLVFEGDRVDVRAKTMNRDKDWNPDWFNFGCAGRTLAKMELLRETQRMQGPNPDWARRQAVLKMLVADYCGFGAPFTVTGIPLVWSNNLQVGYGAPNQGIEARWTERGATCLTRPRIDAFPVPQFPDIWLVIDQTCSLPACTNTDLQDFTDTRVISAILRPAPPP